MRVPTNSTSDSVLLHIQRLAARQAQLQTQVSTGQRIFFPDDDPAAAGRVLTMETERVQLRQFQRNAAVALETSQASYGSLQSLKDVSDRAGEIATLGTGTAGPDAMRAYASEVNQLIEQAVQVGNSRFRNDYLFAGTALDTAPFTVTRDANGRATAVAYAGNSARTPIPVSETSTVTPGTTGAMNLGMRDFINELIALRDALTAGDTTAVTAVRPQLEDAEDLLVNAIAEHGVIELRVEASLAQQRARGDDLEKLISGEVDADLPETIVRLSQTSTAYEAALSSGSKILQMSLLDFLR